MSQSISALLSTVLEVLKAASLQLHLNSSTSLTLQTFQHIAFTSQNKMQLQVVFTAFLLAGSAMGLTFQGVCVQGDNMFCQVFPDACGPRELSPGVLDPNAKKASFSTTDTKANEDVCSGQAAGSGCKAQFSCQ
ncbi:hypothetical protein LZ30DRAFT_737511 [Colletotrichum cereale]|nr:hypothetical protein LZ30DRAFT_737511 [Colletotrichum cereale]